MATYTITLAAGTDQFCEIGFEPDKISKATTKAFVRFALPAALRGAVPSAATLYLYSYGMDTGTRATVGVRSTFGAWDGGAAFSALEALTLSDQLDAQQLSAQGAWTAFDVLGDASGGLVEACASSRGAITLVPVYPGTPTMRRERLSIGTLLASPNDGIDFDYPGNAGDGLHLPYLVVVADSSVRYPRPGCAVGGLLY